MNRTKLLQTIRKMRFEEAYGGWREGRLRQEAAARLRGVCERTFRRSVDRSEEAGLQGLIDKRLEPVSHRRAPVDEGMARVDRSRQRHRGWHVNHVHAWYTTDGGTRSSTWVKSRLQQAGVVEKAPGRGKRRERAAGPGRMLHQDASSHAWGPGVKWDWVVTRDGATNEHDSMRFVDEDGTASRLLGVRDVIEPCGLFASLSTDRGSHDWHTPVAGGRGDRETGRPASHSARRWPGWESR